MMQSTFYWEAARYISVAIIPGAGARYFTYANVSIHALLAECDASLLSLHHRLTVSIHALLAECDPVNHLRSE